MKPRIPITDPAFKYIPSASTDLARTFARVRKEQKRELLAEYTVAPAPAKLLPFVPTRKVK